MSDDAGFQPVPAPPVYQPAPQPVPSPSGDKPGLAVASLVLGIVSLTLGVCLAFIAWFAGPAAIITGAMSLKSSKRGMAIAGIVLGVLGTVGGIVNSIVGVMMYMNS